MPPSADWNPALPKAALATPRPTLLSTKSVTSPQTSPTRHHSQATWPRSPWAAPPCAGRGADTSGRLGRAVDRRALGLDIAPRLGAGASPAVAAIRWFWLPRGTG